MNAGKHDPHRVPPTRQQTAAANMPARRQPLADLVADIRVAILSDKSGEDFVDEIDPLTEDRIGTASDIE